MTLTCLSSVLASVDFLFYSVWQLVLVLDMTSDFLLKFLHLGIMLWYPGSYLNFLFYVASSDTAQIRKEVVSLSYFQVKVNVQMALDPRTPGSWLEPKADAQPLSHPPSPLPRTGVSSGAWIPVPAVFCSALLTQWFLIWTIVLANFNVRGASFKNKRTCELTSSLRCQMEKIQGLCIGFPKQLVTNSH